MLTPATPSAAFGIGEKGGADPVEMYLNDVFTVTVNMAGLPGIAVPAGLDAQGLPLGLQLIGKPFDEETLFALGQKIEDAAGRFRRSGGGDVRRVQSVGCSELRRRAISRRAAQACGGPRRATGTRRTRSSWTTRAREAAWVHAYLHRVEGDLPNAGYWYRTAGKPVAEGRARCRVGRDCGGRCLRARRCAP